jgi:hypothetical protein
VAARLLLRSRPFANRVLRKLWLVEGPDGRIQLTYSAEDGGKAQLKVGMPVNKRLSEIEPKGGFDP